MRSLIRHISVFACSLLWNNGAKICNPLKFIRKYWAQLVLSSIAIQTIACAYGGEDPYGEYSDFCRPEFDSTKFTHEGYSECEERIVERVLIAEDLQNNFNKREDATIEAWSEAQNKIYELSQTCDMSHLKAEGSLKEYVCGDGRKLTIDKN